MFKDKPSVVEDIKVSNTKKGRVSDDCCDYVEPVSCGKPIFPENITVYESGENGYSAYEIAIANGFVGTETQWLLSLQGSNGTDGRSAYQVAVDNGFVGTEEEWLESLEGLSAYEVWLSLGNVGTEEDFFAYLGGEAGTIETITSDVTVGGVEEGDLVDVGTILANTETLKKILTKTFYPVLVAPTFSLTNNAGLREIGQSANFTSTFNFNRGSITLQGVFQNFRAGASNSYTINATTQAGNVLSITGYTVLQGINTITGTVSYDTGAIPLNSKGLALDANGNPLTALLAGTSPTQSTSFEGVYPLFATSSSITSATKQTLVSMLSANNVGISLVAETGGNKQFFEIPDAWLSARPLVYIQYFNTVSNSFDTTNKLSDFTVTSVSNIIQGTSIGYKRYTYNGSGRSNILIRLGF
jgi:hypothetical protein